MKNLLSTAGRTRRSTLLLGFLLYSVICAVLLVCLEAVQRDPIPYLFICYLLLITYWSFIAMVCRRLHDINLSAWFILVLIVPVVSLLFMLVIVLADSTVGDNRFGKDPKSRTPKDRLDPEFGREGQFYL